MSEEQKKEDCKTCGPTTYKGLKKDEPVNVIVEVNGESNVVDWRQAVYGNINNKIVIENVEGIVVEEKE